MDTMPLVFERNNKEPFFIQLYELIKKEIVSGRLKEGDKIPSIRKLGAALTLSRTTVEAAYHQLEVEGYIESRDRSGYYVGNVGNGEFISVIDRAEALPGKDKLAGQLLPEYDFSDSGIDRDSFDFNLWRKYINRALHDTDSFLGSLGWQGEEILRKEIDQHIHYARGVLSSSDKIMIGAGVQSLLNVFCGAAREEYREIGFEEPGFRYGRQIFADHGFNIIPLRLDDEGIDVGELEASNVRIVYVSPSHQFPTGSVMSVKRRMQLLGWAKRVNGLIIEDDYDSELTYYSRPVPSLQSMSGGERVIYLGSFSKVLLPSLRISFMVLPEMILTSYRDKLAAYNQTASKTEQLALAMYMHDGMLKRRIRRLRKLYAVKNRILQASVTKYFGVRARMSGSDSGLHILLEIDMQMDAEEAAARAMAAGVVVTPMTGYYLQEGKDFNHTRILLSYGSIPADRIEEGIYKLSQVWLNKG